MAEGFKFNKRPGILYDEMFETLASGVVNRIIAVQDVEAGTLKYYKDGSVYTPTGTVGDVPYAVVTGVETLSVDNVTVESLTIPANSVSCQIYIHDKTAIFTLDGTTPVDGSVGFALDNGSMIELRSPDEMSGFRVLNQQAGAAMPLYVVYSNVTPEGMI